MRILLDTNILLDIALKRDPHFLFSVKAFKMIDGKAIFGFITATTVTDLYYISKKECGHDIAIQFINNLLSVVDVLEVNKKIILLSLNSSFPDFEDAIQINTAKINDVEVIITRNPKDFVETEITILSPKQFIEDFMRDH